MLQINLELNQKYGKRARFEVHQKIINLLY